MKIQITPTLIVRDSDGALFIRYTPQAVSFTCLSRGSLSFAAHDCAVGDSQAEHDAVKANARKSAIESLRLLVAQLS